MSWCDIKLNEKVIEENCRHPCLTLTRRMTRRRMLDDPDGQISSALSLVSTVASIGMNR